MYEKTQLLSASLSGSCAVQGSVLGEQELFRENSNLLKQDTAFLSLVLKGMGTTLRIVDYLSREIANKITSNLENIRILF